MWLELQTIAVVCQKQACGDPSSPLIAVYKTMVLCKAVRIASGEIGRIGRCISRKIEGADERAFDAADVANPL